MTSGSRKELLPLPPPELLRKAWAGGSCFLMGGGASGLFMGTYGGLSSLMEALSHEAPPLYFKLWILGSFITWIC